MTLTSALNSVLLILGPVIGTYFAFDLHKKEDGQGTAIRAGLLNIGTETLKLIILALLAPLLFQSGLTMSEETPLVFQWAEIAFNTLLSVLLETYALRYMLAQRHLMKHEPRKSTKIVAVACGWAFCHMLCTQILKAVTRQMYEDTVRADLILSSFSALFDFVRIIGTTFLIEKLNRKGIGSEAKTFIYLTLAAVTFMAEVCNSRIDKNEASLNELSSRSLLVDKTLDSASSMWTNEPLKLLFGNTILLKGAVALCSIAANYLY